MNISRSTAQTTGVLVILGLLMMIAGCRNVERTSPNADPVSKTYIGPHHEHYSQYAQYDLQSEGQWDSLHGATTHPQVPTWYQRDPRYKVFGWHLYSEGTAYQSIDYDLLWGVAYFSYLIDPVTGSYRNLHQWKTTNFVTLAKQHGCQVFLSASLFGAEQNRTFLRNARAIKILADSLIAVLDLRLANGVNLDFEGVPGDCRNDLTRAIQMVSKRLKGHNPEWLISLNLYAIDHQHVLDLAAIDSAIDFYTMMEYDFYGSFSAVAGPVSPLHASQEFGPECIEASVNTYLAQGVAKDKLIVGIPYYGADWVVTHPSLPSQAKRFVDHPRYTRILSAYVDSMQLYPKVHAESASAWMTFEYSPGETRQIWFDNAHTLGMKFDWIKEQELAGAALWVPAYGDTSLWPVVGSRFGIKN